MGWPAASCEQVPPQLSCPCGASTTKAQPRSWSTCTRRLRKTRRFRKLCARPCCASPVATLQTGCRRNGSGRTTGRAWLLLVPLPVCPSSDDLVSQRRAMSSSANDVAHTCLKLTHHGAAISRACAQETGMRVGSRSACDVRSGVGRGDSVAGLSQNLEW